MMFSRQAVGLDLGSHAVKIVDLRVTDSGAVVTQALHIPRAELGVPPGDARALAAAIRPRWLAARIPTRGVVLGIGGRDSMLRYTRVPPVPSWRLKALMDYEVREISEKLGEPLSSDFLVLQLPREMDEEQTILIGLAKEKPLEETLAAFEAEGIPIEQAVPSPLALHALQDAFGVKAPDDARDDELVILADLGSECLNLAFVLNGRLAFARTAGFGSRQFTEALARVLGVPEPEAERLKIARGGLDPTERGVLADGAPALSSIAAQFFGLLQSSLRFCATQTGARLPPPNRLVLTGAGARLRGLAPFLAKSLGHPVGFFQPAGMQLSGGVDPEAAKLLGESPGDFGTALGLAVTRLRSHSAREGIKTTANILPAKYVRRREFRDRTVFLYAAGAILLLALLLRTSYAWIINSTARDTLAQLTTAQKDLEATKADMDATNREVQREKAVVNRLLREAELTGFQAYILETLARTLRPEMQLDRVTLDDGELSEDGTFVDYSLHIECRVSNEKRQAFDWIRELQTTLQSLDRVGSVQEEGSSSDRMWRVFKLAVKPSYVSY